MKQYVAPAMQVMATEMTSEILAASDAFTINSDDLGIINQKPEGSSPNEAI